MLITEEEAKTKICPFIRALKNEEEVIFGVMKPIEGQSRCITSSCMMWLSYSDGRGSCGLVQQVHPSLDWTKVPG